MSASTGTNVVASSTTISDLHLDVLQPILGYLSGKPCFLLYLAGDTKLNRILALGALEEFELRYDASNSRKNALPNIYSYFPSLKRFIFQMGGTVPPKGRLSLELLPRTLQGLDLRFHGLPDSLKPFFDANHMENSLANLFPQLKLLKFGTSTSAPWQQWRDWLDFLPLSLTKLRISSGISSEAVLNLNRLHNLLSLKLSCTSLEKNDEFWQSDALPSSLTSLVILDAYPDIINQIITLDNLTYLDYQGTYLQESDLDLELTKKWLQLPRGLIDLRARCNHSNDPTFIRSLPQSLTSLILYQKQGYSWEEVTGTLPRGLTTLSISGRHSAPVQWDTPESSESKRDRMIACMKSLPPNLKSLSNLFGSSYDAFGGLEEIRALPRSLTLLQDHLFIKTKEELSALPIGIRHCRIEAPLLQSEDVFSMVPTGIRHLSFGALALPRNIAQLIKKRTSLAEIVELDIESFGVLVKDVLEDGTLIPLPEPTAVSLQNDYLLASCTSPEAENAAGELQRAESSMATSTSLLDPPSSSDSTSSPSEKPGVLFLDVGQFSPPFLTQLMLMTRPAPLFHRYVIDLRSLGSQNTLKKFQIHHPRMHDRSVGPDTGGRLEFLGLSAFTNLDTLLLRFVHVSQQTLHAVLQHCSVLRIFRVQSLLHPMTDDDLKMMPKSLTLLCIQGVDSTITPRGIGSLPIKSNTVVLPPSPLAMWDKVGMTIEEAISLLPPNIRRIHFGWPFSGGSHTCWKEAISERDTRRSQESGSVSQS